MNAALLLYCHSWCIHCKCQLVPNICKTYTYLYLAPTFHHEKTILVFFLMCNDHILYVLQVHVLTFINKFVSRPWLQGGGILTPYSSVLMFVLWPFNGYFYNTMLINVLIKDFKRELIYTIVVFFIEVRDTFYWYKTRRYVSLYCLSILIFQKSFWNIILSLSITFNSNVPFRSPDRIGQSKPSFAGKMFGKVPYK